MDDYYFKLLGTGTVVATAAAYFLLKKPEPFNTHVDFSNQTHDVLVSSARFVPSSNPSACRGFIKRREAGIFPFYSGMFPLLLLKKIV